LSSSASSRMFSSSRIARTSASSCVLAILFACRLCATMRTRSTLQPDHRCSAKNER
jgi:hypothetical protein